MHRHSQVKEREREKKTSYGESEAILAKTAVVCFCFRTVTSPKTMVSVSLVPFTCTCAVYVQCTYVHTQLHTYKTKYARALVFLSAVFNCERVGAFLLCLLGSIRLHIVRVVCCCCSAALPLVLLLLLLVEINAFHFSRCTPVVSSISKRLQRQQALKYPIIIRT